MKPVIRVLGVWQPSEPTEKAIREEFIGWAKLRVPQVASYIELRQPNILDWNSFQWHHDNDYMKNNPPFYTLIVWSNVKPTWLSYKGRQVMKNAPDGAVIAIDNAKVKHRTPDVTIEDKRWFLRTYIPHENTKRGSFFIGGLALQ